MNFNIYIKIINNMKDLKHIRRFNESEENLNSETLDKSSSISDVRSSKLNNGRFYVIQEDGGYQLFFMGIYDDINIFIENIKSKISISENIGTDDIKIELDKLDNRDVILVKYGYSEDIFYYDEVSVNEIDPI
jgi:hypothetical protein